MDYHSLAQCLFEFWDITLQSITEGRLIQASTSQGIEEKLDHLLASGQIDEADKTYILHRKTVTLEKAVMLTHLQNQLGQALCFEQPLQLYTLEVRAFSNNTNEKNALLWTLVHMLRLVEPSKVHENSLVVKNIRNYYEYLCRIAQYEKQLLPFKQCLWCGSTSDDLEHRSRLYCGGPCKNELYNRIKRFKQHDQEYKQKTGKPRPTETLRQDFQALWEEFYKRSLQLKTPIREEALDEGSLLEITRFCGI